MDLSRIEGTFTAPDEVISIVGCGAIGSQVALQLTKLGCTKFHLYDLDQVDSHNLVNQAYRAEQVGQTKVDALKALIHELNEKAEVKTFHGESEELLKLEERLEGYVFLCPDKVSVRKHCLTKNRTSPAVLGWFDCRTELWAVQVFGRKHTAEDIKSLLDTLDFTDEEAEASIPRASSGCHSKQASGITSALGALTMAKLFVDFVKTNAIKIFTRIDVENFNIDSF